MTVGKATDGARRARRRMAWLGRVGPRDDRLVNTKIRFVMFWTVAPLLNIQTCDIVLHLRCIAITAIQISSAILTKYIVTPHLLRVGPRYDQLVNTKIRFAICWTAAPQLSV